MGLISLWRTLLHYAELPTDDKETIFRKRLLLSIALLGVITGTGNAVLAILEGVPVQIGMMLFGFVLHLVFATLVYLTRSLPLWAAGLYTVIAGGFTVASDLWTYGLYDFYTVSVLVMDVLLLCKCPDFFAHGTLVVTASLISVQTVEQTRGIGLYDAIPTSWSGQERPPKKGGDLTMLLLLIRMCVFVLDFIMTRHFSTGMRMERERVERSVVVAQQIASALARFDLDKADRMVKDAEGGLPADLLEALECLVGNLRSYRPYLPPSCFTVLSDPDSTEGEEDQGQQNESSHHSDISVISMSNKPDPTLAPAPLQKKKITLMLTNIRHFLQLAGRDENLLSAVHEEYLTQVFDVVRTSWGLVDHFTADRVLISFNGARKCHAHIVQSVQCAAKLRQLPRLEGLEGPTMSLAFSSGTAYCGVLGCTELKSYSMVGRVAAWVPVLERVSAHFDTQAITDGSVANVTAEMGTFRLLGMASFEKYDGQLELYDFQGVKGSENVEWMYQYSSTGVWESYNKCKRLLITARVREAWDLASSELADAAEDEPHTWKLLDSITKAKADNRRFYRWTIDDHSVTPLA